MNDAEKAQVAWERSQQGPSAQAEDWTPTDSMSPEEWAEELDEVGMFLARQGLYEKASTCLGASNLIREMASER